MLQVVVIYLPFFPLVGLVWGWWGPCGLLFESMVRRNNNEKKCDAISVRWWLREESRDETPLANQTVFKQSRASTLLHSSIYPSIHTFIHEFHTTVLGIPTVIYNFDQLICLTMCYACWYFLSDFLSPPNNCKQVDIGTELYISSMLHFLLLSLHQEFLLNFYNKNTIGFRTDHILLIFTIKLSSALNRSKCTSLNLKVVFLDFGFVL